MPTSTARGRCSTSSARSASTSTTSAGCSRTRGSRRSRRPSTSSSTRSPPRPLLSLDYVARMNGELVVVDDVAGEFAERVIEAYHARPADEFSIAVSGGETARRCYERLAEDAGTQIDWWKVDVYWGDERCVPPGDGDSNERLVREALLDRVGAANAVYPMR